MPAAQPAAERQADDDHRVAVIENELGSVPLDSMLVANTHEAMPVFTVANGCVPASCTAGCTAGSPADCTTLAFFISSLSKSPE